MRILIADAFPSGHLDRLRALGHDVDHQPGLGAEDLPAAIAGSDVLVVRSTKVTAATVDADETLSLVIRAGAGVNTIDLDAAARRAVLVANVPGRNAIAVAELTMGLLLAIDRSIADATADLRAGRWDKGRYSKADGLHGKTMAILGFGSIGQQVAVRARAFGLRVLIEDRPGRHEATLALMAAHGVETVPDRAALLAAADIVSLHVPAADSTRGMVDAAFLAQLRDGAWLLNTSRGEVVDSAALLTALDERGMRAGLDVFDGEPAAKQAAYDDPLASHPAVVGTHHIGASTTQAQLAIADGVLDLVAAHDAGQLRAAVNLVDEPRGACTLVVRHRNEVGVLSQVLVRLREDGINLEQMENRIFAGGLTAVAIMQLSRPPSGNVLADVRGLDAVIGVQARDDDGP